VWLSFQFIVRCRGGSSRGLQPSLKNVRQKIPPNGQTSPSLDLVTKFHNTIIFSTSDTILAQRFLGIQQNQCFVLFQQRRLCDDVFSTLADEFGYFGAVFGTAIKKPNNWVQETWWYIRLSQSVFIILTMNF